MFDSFFFLLGWAVFLFFTLIFLRLLVADADLFVIHRNLRQEYFRDRVVWVTGASSGIGEALVRQLSSVGAKVILSSRSASKLEAIRESLDHPENARVLEVDVAQTEMAEAAAEKAVQLFGRIDMLVNNAGVSQRGLYSDFPPEMERRLFDVDFFGAVALTRAVLPYLIRQSGGHICNISSIAGKIGGPGRTAYGAAKAALLNYMDALRLELRGLKHDIVVTNVCPGPVRTNVDRNALRGDGSTHDREDILIRRGMTTKRCAHLTLVAMSQRISEIWVARQPYLYFTYIAQYMPVIFLRLIKMSSGRMVRGVQAQTANDEEKKDQ